MPSDPGCCLTASLPPVGGEPVCSWLGLFWYYSFSPLFCERAQQSLRLELFTGKFSLSLSPFFPFPSLAIPRFGLLFHVSVLRLPSGYSGPVLTLSNAARTSLFSPRLLVVNALVWATSPLEVAVSCIICGFYLFIFPSWLCCPLRFQNSQQTHQ